MTGVAGPARAPVIAGVFVILLYVALSLLYARATPPLEAVDEAGHMAFVLELQQSGGLPVADPRSRDLRMTQEYTQPPLYYLPAALLIRRIDTANWGWFFIPRDGAPVGRADVPGPKHIWRVLEPRTFPYEGTLLAIHTTRAYSMLLGVGVVLVTGLLARRLAPRDSWAPVLAMSLVAFNPMFLFISNAVNNDTMAALLVPAVLLALIARADDVLRPAVAAGIGALTGLAILAKISALILLPATAVWLIGRSGPPRRRAVALAVWLGTVMAVSGWWFVRNQVLYGAWLAFDVHVALAHNLRPQMDLLALAREWTGLVKSFWGVFGAFNVIYPSWAYDLFYGVTLVGLTAAAGQFVARRGRPAPGAWLLGGVAVLNLLALVWWTARLTGSQGRLLFPSLAAVAVLVAVGVSRWPPLGRAAVSVSVVGWLIAMAAYGALVVIPAEYP